MGYRNFSGKGRANASIGSKGGAQAHTPGRESRIAQTRARSEYERTQAGLRMNAPALAAPTPRPYGMAGPVPSLGPENMLQPPPRPNRLLTLGRQFNAHVHEKVGGAEGLHEKLNMVANAYHDVQVLRAPGAYGYIHAIRRATAGPSSDFIGPAKQEEIALQRFYGVENK